MKPFDYSIVQVISLFVIQRSPNHPECSFGYKIVPVVAVVVAKFFILNLSHLLLRLLMAHSQGLRQAGGGSNVEVLFNRA